MPSVYWIHHPSHTDLFTQGYIGISANVKNRWEVHKNRTQNAHLRNAIKKYGWDNLIKKIILIAEESYCLMIEEKLRPQDNLGWNICKGGNKPKSGIEPWNKGLPMSEETKKKLSQSKKGFVPWIAGKKGIFIAWNKGKKTSPETRLKQSIAKIGKQSPRKGVVLSIETIEKMRKAKVGKCNLSELGRQAIIKAHKGIKQTLVSCIYCKKSGGVMTMPRWHFDNCKYKENQ